MEFQRHLWLRLSFEVDERMNSDVDECRKPLPSLWHTETRGGSSPWTG